MSNSFNISVKPEIASVKADTADIRTDVTAIHDTNLPAVKTDTADIRTDVTAIHDTDLPAAKTVIDENKVLLVDIEGTDLPAAKAVIDSNASDIGHIRNTAIPNVITEINSNETKIDTIDGIVDAIKLKTDNIPLKFRGHFTLSDLTTSSSSLVDVVNVTGQGKLVGLGARCTNAADTFELLVSIDGKAAVAVSHTGDTTLQVLVPTQGYSSDYNFTKLTDPVSQLTSFNVEFDTSLLVQLRRSAGTDADVRCAVQYLLHSV